MKKNGLKIAALALLISQFSTSCKKFVDGENISPNLASNVNPALLLSASELAVFSTHGGQISRTASMWVQQSAGCQQQSEAYDAYAVDEGDVDNEWTDLYGKGLKNLKKLKEVAGSDNPYYQGIADILSADLVGVATDFWGDIPWSDALKGESQQYTAKYDKQEDILNSIQNLLSAGIENLRKPETANKLLPATDDYIYNGDPQKWIAFAYVLKARYHMRTSKHRPTWHVEALKNLDSAYANGFTGSDANANCIFGSNSAEYNQWYAFTKVSRKAYMMASLTFTDIMKASNDPRIPFYFTKNERDNYDGSPLGSSIVDSVSDIGDFFASPTSPTPIATYVEAKFIEAEALLAAGNATAAATAHNDAVKAHVLHVTGAAAPSAFVTSNASETAGSITLQKIITQKYIAGYTMLEPYNDWRRTNFPALTKNPNATINGIARRFPTPINERLYNSAALGSLQTGINDLASDNRRVWWDKL